MTLMYVFQDGGHIIANILSLSGFMTSCLHESKFCVSNFDQTYQLTAKVLLLPVAEKRTPYLYSTPGFDELFTVTGMGFCTDP